MKTSWGFLLLSLALTACSSVAPIPITPPVAALPSVETPIVAPSPSVPGVDPIGSTPPGYVCTPPPELVCTRAPTFLWVEDCPVQPMSSRVDRFCTGAIEDYGPMNFVYCLDSYKKCALGELWWDGESRYILQSPGHWDVLRDTAHPVGVFVRDPGVLGPEFKNVDVALLVTPICNPGVSPESCA